MRVFSVLTLFPDFFDGPFRVSMLKRAIENKLVKVEVNNLRDWSRDKHRKTDAHPYGGGAGMVMTPQPLHDAIRAMKKKYRTAKVVVFSAKGRLMDQAVLRELSRHKRFILVAGHYEGIDERIADYDADFELSMGNYVVTGGEYACLVFIDGITRLLKGVLHNEASHQDESFEDGLLEYDQYTRPEVFMNRRVPEVLLSGDHAKIRAWRKESRDKNTLENRPDLLCKGETP